MRRNESSFIFYPSHDTGQRRGSGSGNRSNRSDSYFVFGRFGRGTGRRPGACGCAAGRRPKADPPAPLTTPAVTGPLAWLPPAIFDAGPLGKIAANGIVTGSGLVQNNHVPGDDVQQAALSNGQIFIQKADGKYQYFIQVGAYTMPSLATPFLPADKTVSDFFGPVPVAFLKLPVGKTTQFLIGSLPTLMGAESTFTFQNMNIERGLLWNQENAVNRGIQVNQTWVNISPPRLAGTMATIPTAIHG